MKRTLISLLAAALALSAGHVDAGNIPLITGPQNVAALNNTLNNLINQINANAVIGFGGISAAPPGYFGTVANGAQFVGTIAGLGTQPAFGVQLNTAGSDSSINLVLSPKGPNGYLEFGNSNAFVATQGLAACPGYQVNQVRPIGISATIQGYVTVLDYLGRQHWLPVC